VHPKPNVFLPSVMSQRAAEELLAHKVTPSAGLTHHP